MLITRSFSETDGIVRVSISGDWETKAVDDHFEHLRALIETVRARNIPVRVMIDARGSPIPPQSFDKQLGEQARATYTPDDRVAILTSGLAEKNHSRQFLNNINVWAWESEIAAEQWLFLPSD